VYRVAIERHERLPWESRVPVPEQEVRTLRALIVGLCALTLATLATAETIQDEAIGATRTTTTAKRQARATLSVEQRLTRSVAVARKQRGAVRFFRARPTLLRSRKHGEWARAALRRAERRLARVERRIAFLQRSIARRERRRLVKLPPRAAICAVFQRHCRQAVAVAWCESRLDTSARNGQYLGLFQMGWYERRLFGHGPSAFAQSRAAHRYFVRSGRDWSPWGCKPWYWE
jgi:hypothetical protein